MPISLPGDIAYDIRQPIVGDSFSWEAIEPAAAKKSIVIHGTASQAANEDGFTMADYHVNHNGWGGIGVHFVATKDSYPGYPQFGLPAGAQLQYVGDLLTWRAGTLNQNPGRIHIEISGLFTAGNGVPSEAQLRVVRKFIDYALAKNNVLPSLNYYNQVTYHNAVPGQNTDCPGWNNPQFAEWFNYLQGGAEPSWWTPAPVAPTPPPVVTPAPPVVTPTPAPPVVVAPPTPVVPTGQTNAPVVPITVTPGYVATFQEIHESRVVLRDGAYAVDVPNNMTLEATRDHLLKGTVIDVWGYFSSNGDQYARTKYAVQHDTWTGIPLSFLQPPDVPDPPVEAAPVAVPVHLSEATTGSLRQIVSELVAIVVSPLVRLLGINKEK